jgi:phosphomannomutase
VTDPDLDRIFKAYDVRGVVPDELDASIARRIGAAFAVWANLPAILLGRDSRISSPELAAAITEGATSVGVNVVDLGLASTDLVYFASGSLDLPAVMLTASHNPKDYNGLKFCMPGARPVGEDSGLREIRAIVERGDIPPAATKGTVSQRDLLAPYTEHVLSFVDVAAMRPMTVAVDTANGMGGLVVPAVMARLPVTLHHLYAELDGTFPNHPADPLDPENQKDLKAGVLEHHADVGLAFDGDADRVFLVDEKAEDVSGSLLTALVARAMLRQEPGEDRAQPDLLVDRSRVDPRRGRGADPHAGRSFVHQAGHGRDGGDLRWRTLRPLLLPQQLPRRFGPDRRRGRHGRALVGGGATVRRPRAVPQVFRLRRDQLPGR